MVIKAFLVVEELFLYWLDRALFLLKMVYVQFLLELDRGLLEIAAVDFGVALVFS